MTDKATHTPLPWERQTLETEYDPGVYIVGSNLGGLVGAALPWPTEIESGDYSRVEANAALIVQAVNSHHDLIEALKIMRSYGCPVCNGDCGSANPPVMSCPMQMINAALTKAEAGR